LFTIYGVSGNGELRKKKYPSDISREQFEQIQPLLESALKRIKPMGRSSKLSPEVK
jgi:hypothetical protein